MTCNDATEFVSALCDGETIPREAAEHIGACKACQAILTEYLEIGTELRCIASLAAPEALRPLSLKKKHGTMRAIWQTGWETMRIPRFAFATLLIGIVALSLSLALAKVRAHSEGNVLMLTVTTDRSRPHLCPLSTLDKKKAVCDQGDRVISGYLTYNIRLLSKDDDHVKLEVHTEFQSRGDNASLQGPETASHQFLFTPGETLEIHVVGLGPITITGEGMAYMPYFADLDLEHNLEPSANELRIIAPVLLRAKQVVVDFGGTSVTGEQKDDLAWFYVPGDGLYELSLSQLPGAIQGRAENNRLTFTIDGQSLTLLTGAPIARSQDVWVLHTANVKPAGPQFSRAVIGMEEINHLIPRTKTKN